MCCKCMERGKGAGYWFCGFKRKCCIITIILIILIILIGVVIAVVLILYLPNEDPPLEEYQKMTMELHNEYRLKHGVPPLTHNATLRLCIKALKCAKYYSKKGTIDHTCTYKNEDGFKVGENLFRSGGGMMENSDENKISQSLKATRLWYEEVKHYNYKLNHWQPPAGHFTAIVWNSTKNLCVGVVIDGYVTVVALYYPPGNVQKGYKTNVFNGKG